MGFFYGELMTWDDLVYFATAKYGSKGEHYITVVNNYQISPIDILDCYRKLDKFPLVPKSYLYVLLHNDIIMYVGFTVSPTERLIKHRSSGRILKSLFLDLEMEIVEVFDDYTEAKQAEYHLIEAMINNGSPLLNLSVLGYTEEVTLKHLDLYTSLFWSWWPTPSIHMLDEYYAYHDKYVLMLMRRHEKTLVNWNSEIRQFLKAQNNNSN